MKILITEEQYNMLHKNLDDVLDLFSKTKRGEELKPSEQAIIQTFRKYVDKGGNPDEFIYTEDDIYDIDRREGMVFKFNIAKNSLPIRYTFSEEYEENTTINYFGELTFNGDEFLGIISTDKKGYFVGYDFYSVFDDTIRLQDILKEMNLEAEVTYNFAENIIPKLNNYQFG